MVDQDELEWQRRVHGEAQQAAYIQAMKDSQQQEEYKNKCMSFVIVLKELRKRYPNDQQFGRVVSKILNKEEL